MPNNQVWVGTYDSTVFMPTRYILETYGNENVVITDLIDNSSNGIYINTYDYTKIENENQITGTINVYCDTTKQIAYNRSVPSICVYTKRQKFQGGSFIKNCIHTIAFQDSNASANQLYDDNYNYVGYNIIPSKDILVNSVATQSENILYGFVINTMSEDNMMVFYYLNFID